MYSIYHSTEKNSKCSCKTFFVKCNNSTSALNHFIQGYMKSPKPLLIDCTPWNTELM